MNKQNNQNNKPGFRPTPTQVADSLKILTGVKTNSTIRDLEEEEGELEEKEGVVVSIQEDKINGAGWTVKDDKGELYVCSCASNMYDLPETQEHGGVLYPSDNVKVIFEINPVLQLNRIIEVTSLGSEDEKIDISKWKHGDAATTVIAKPRAAISISDSQVSFNYDNANKITANNKSIDLNGKQTNINSNQININGNVNINGNNLENTMKQISTEVVKNDSTKTTGGATPTDMSKVFLEYSNNIAQVTVNGKMTINQTERVIADIKDPQQFPTQTQQYSLLTNNGIDKIKVRPNGIVTVECIGEPGQRDILSTHNWVAPKYDMRSVIATKTTNICDYCQEVNSTNIFINYCPACKTWHMLSYVKDNVICNKCGVTYCASCGHRNDVSYSDTDLKVYLDSNISLVSSPCDYCQDYIGSNKNKVYANYCPICKTWYSLSLDNIIKDENEIHQLYCENCNTYYCGNCGTEQSGYKMKSFLDNYIQYETYMTKMHKLVYIKED